jgi:ABC-type uncharacterized transport system ATPase subunit
MKQLFFIAVLAASSSCALDNSLGGSVSELFPLEVSRVEVQKNDEALQITYLRNRGDMAILLVEQYLEFAHELADDFAVMDRGEVVMSGTRETFDAEAVRKHMTV